MGSHLKDIKLYVLDPFHLLGPTSFRKYKQVNRIYSSSGSTAPPKRTSADITQKVPKTLTFIFKLSDRNSYFPSYKA